MKNIFSQTKDYVKPPKRNVFDLSFSSNLTMNFGTLYPVFCKPVLPGDSFSIDPTFALRFLPTAFPVQTKINANLHFFYVRNRNLWDGWQKFIGNTDSTRVMPYIDASTSFFSTCSLADYLGVPTTLVGNYSRLQSDSIKDYMFVETPTSIPHPYSSINDWSIDIDYSELFGGNPLSSMLSRVYNPSTSSCTIISGRPIEGYISSPIVANVTDLSTFGNFSSTTKVIISKVVNGQSLPVVVIDLDASYVPDKLTFSLWLGPHTNYYFVDDLGVTPRNFDSLGEALSEINSRLNGSFTLSFYQNKNITSSGLSWMYQLNAGVSGTIDVSVSYGSVVRDLSAVQSDDNPFIASNSDSIRLNALPFRAYESIYNAFYRNEQNDPLILNGKPEYDKYVPNTDDGSDSYPYKLYRRNWELDFMTSAVQSPQQGIAPLVGVSSSGDFTFVHKDSNGNIGYFSAKANLSPDGESITSVSLSDKVELDGLPTTPYVAHIPDDVKRGTVYNLKQMALAGISINDFRNVNALQRWLETNIRRGYKYRDQIKSHFGVDIDFKTLDMPEFIGGISEPVFSSQVNQTTETETDPLGSYAGQLSLIAKSNHAIRHYCDEHGYIIGIMSIVPVPNYSQVLPKDYIKSNYLDYYYPEFGHIGMQPIDYREVCPLQAYAVDPSSLSDTFGYQRAWYDYIASLDEVHGLFRTNLRNFVLNRQFDTFPRLNKDFLQVDPNQLNDIFTVQDVSDKILGQIYFNVVAKRPIPKFSIPRLE
ncbi:major capsid protein [Sigmofec virus UA08Rod_4411]|uniref:Major capsid protein n=1 Tax=Sigmofec virus UA08Rod_4411 TaxID=2929401 RepID=A0A976N2H8_9VIRU|nr:major capsid protein [Sigmofec virus UA08Rod_4411]